MSMANQCVAVLVVLSFMSTVNGCVSMMDSSLLPFETKDQIKQYATDQYGPSETTSMVVNDKEIFVVFGQWTSGTVKLDINVFLYKPKSKVWGLALTKRTNASEISVRVEDDNILFYSEKNKLLLLQPFETLATD